MTMHSQRSKPQARAGRASRRLDCHSCAAWPDVKIYEDHWRSQWENLKL